MTEPESPPECLRERARIVVETFQTQFHITLNYDGESLFSIETYLELIRELLPEQDSEGFITSVGAYLGECLVQQCGGTWSNEPGWWGIRLAEGVFASPFVQVRSQLREGIQQSVVRYFRCLSDLTRRLALLGDPADSFRNQQWEKRLREEMDYWSLQLLPGSTPGGTPLNARKAI